MLNLTNMFSMRPHKIEGARFVKGYAMSGCHQYKVEMPVSPFAEKGKRNEEAILAALKSGEAMGITAISKVSGVSTSSISGAINRLVKRGLVERGPNRTWKINASGA